MRCAHPPVESSTAGLLAGLEVGTFLGFLRQSSVRPEIRIDQVDRPHHQILSYLFIYLYSLISTFLTECFNLLRCADSVTTDPCCPSGQHDAPLCERATELRCASRQPLLVLRQRRLLLAAGRPGGVDPSIHSPGSTQVGRKRCWIWARAPGVHLTSSPGGWPPLAARCR